MSGRAQRRLVRTLALTMLVGIAGAPAVPAAEQVIQLSARKFQYSAQEIRVKKGVPVVIELTSEDRLHGFSLPSFGVRADAVPGKITRVRFVPDKAGRHEFLCDVFCGDGHEEMSAVLIVED